MQKREMRNTEEILMLPMNKKKSVIERKIVNLVIIRVIKIIEK